MRFQTTAIHQENLDKKVPCSALGFQSASLKHKLFQYEFT